MPEPTTRTFACPHCSTGIEIPYELPPTKAPCPSCGQLVTSPARPAENAPDAPKEPDPIPKLEAESSPDPAADALVVEGIEGEEITPKKAPWLGVAVGVALAIAVLVILTMTLSRGNRSGSGDNGVAFQPVLSAEEREARAYQTTGWIVDCQQVLENFLNAKSISEAVSYTLRGAANEAEMASVGSEFDKNLYRTPVSLFAPVQLKKEDTERGIYLMTYDRPSQYSTDYFFRPVPPLRVQYLIDKPDVLLVTEALTENFIDDRLLTMALFKKTSEGIKLDWQIYAQTKYSLLQRFSQNPEPGQREIFRGFLQQDVDFDGNVTLRGSSNLRILINGKPSGMFSDNPADALKMFPADQIKSVEVITTPSAKYDGEGSGGIINIITKKKSIQGVSGNVSASAGNRQNNGVVSLSAAKGRFGINANTSVYYSVPNDATSTFNRSDISDGFTRVLNQDGTNRSSRLGFRGSAGAFYDINAYNSINSNFSISGRTFNSDGLTRVTFDDPANNFLQEYTRASEGNNGYNSFDWTTDYKKTFPQKDRELSIAFQLNGNNQDNDLDYDQVNIQNAENFEERGKNDGTNREYTYQIDYTHPFSKAVKLEVGGKSVIRRINSDYDYTVISGAFDTPFLSDVFDYNQDVIAGYASFNFNFGENWGLVAGARYEQTDINGDFEVDGNPFENSYNNLLPSIIISRKFKNFQTVKLSYTARIQRPSLFYINPYTNASDRRNTQVGNPLLDPETVDQFDLSYNTFIKGTVVSASIYYKQTNDIIESFLTVDPAGVSITTYQNIGKNNAIGFNLFSSATIKKKLTIRGSFNYNTYDVTGITTNGESVSRQASEYNGNLSGTYDFGKGFKMEGFTFFRSNRQTIQGNIPSFSMYSVGFKKEIWEKRGSVGIRMVEPFTKFKSFTTELTGDNFSLDSVYRLPFRSFGLSFSYRFGKLDFKAKSKRNSKIKNTDLKSGEDGNGF